MPGESLPTRRLLVPSVFAWAQARVGSPPPRIPPKSNPANTAVQIAVPRNRRGAGQERSECIGGGLWDAKRETAREGASCDGSAGVRDARRNQGTPGQLEPPDVTRSHFHTNAPGADRQFSLSQEEGSPNR